MLKNLCFFLLTIIIFTNVNFGQISLGENSLDPNSIISAQTISVTIGGEFITNGSFPASSNERVDQFVTRIFNTIRGTILTSLRDENAIRKFLKNNENYALRDIQLIHNDGTTETIDLAKFRLDGNFENNPYLKDGDLIVFPAFDLEKNFISVLGAVNKEVIFQFVDGDNLQTALFFARGIDRSFDGVDSCIISRLDNNGLDEQTMIVSIDSDVNLQSGDRIQVLYKERNNYDYRVLILGEVQRPGSYSIARNSTTLGEIIKKAGGFTEYASLRFSELFRNNNSYLALKKMGIEKLISENATIEELTAELVELRKAEYLKLARTSVIDFADTLYFSQDSELRIVSGYSTLDFRNLLDSTSFESLYPLQDRDLIIIPKKTNDVFVWGGVARVGNYPFDESLDVWDYIEQAGGLVELAYGEDEVYLIKGDSQSWINAYDNEKLIIEPGDYIYAKKEKPVNFGFYLGRISAIAGIIGSAATIILLLNQLGK